LCRIYRSKNFAILNDLDTIYSRFCMMVALNPLSWKMQKIRFQTDALSEQKHTPFPLKGHWDMDDLYHHYEARIQDEEDPFDIEDLSEEADASDDEYCYIPWEDQWDKDEWHRYYVNGIPPLRSEHSYGFYLLMRNQIEEPSKAAFMAYFNPRPRRKKAPTDGYDSSLSYNSDF